jgi:hypothetical protein
MAMSRAELAILREVTNRVDALETRLAKLEGREIPDEIGVDLEAHKTVFPRKTLTLKAKQ